MSASPRRSCSLTYATIALRVPQWRIKMVIDPLSNTIPSEMPARDRDPKVSVAFGRVVRRARHHHDLKQSDLAVMADIGRDTMGRIERGDREPSLGVLLRLAQALDMRPSRLLEAMEEELRR